MGGRASARGDRRADERPIRRRGRPPGRGGAHRPVLPPKDQRRRRVEPDRPDADPSRGGLRPAPVRRTAHHPGASDAHRRPHSHQESHTSAWYRRPSTRQRGYSRQVPQADRPRYLLTAPDRDRKHDPQHRHSRRHCSPDDPAHPDRVVATRLIRLDLYRPKNFTVAWPLVARAQQPAMPMKTLSIITERRGADLPLLLDQPLYFGPNKVALANVQQLIYQLPLASLSG